MGIHNCSLLSRNASHHQATYVVVGKQVASQFLSAQKVLALKAVQSFACTHLKAKISYHKAWRGRKHAQSLIRGSPEKSFYMLEKVNLGTVTHIEVDWENKFKYLFLDFGAAIRDFQYMRKVIGIDGTFLKGSYKGVLLIFTI